MLQVGSYGGKLKYTISYVPTPGARGSTVDDANVQIIVSALELRHPSSLASFVYMFPVRSHVMACCRHCLL